VTPIMNVSLWSFCRISFRSAKARHLVVHQNRIMQFTVGYGSRNLVDSFSSIASIVYCLSFIRNQAFPQFAGRGNFVNNQNTDPLVPTRRKRIIVIGIGLPASFLLTFSLVSSKDLPIMIKWSRLYQRDSSWSSRLSSTQNGVYGPLRSYVKRGVAIATV